MMQEFYRSHLEDRRLRSRFRICVTLSQPRIMVVFVAPRRAYSFGSRRSAVVSVSSKSRSAWPSSKGRAEASEQPKRAVSSSAARDLFLEQVEALAARTQSTGRGEAGRLAVGFYTSLAAGNLRATLIDVSQRFPRLELEMFESSRGRLVTALRNGVVDIAIVPGATALPESRTMPLWSERILVAVPEGHALAERELVHWIDLREEKILLSRRDPVPELHDLLIAKVTSPGDRPKIVRHRAGLANLKSLVGAGFGVTLLTEASAGANFVGVIYRELRDGAEPARIGYSAHWRPDNQNPALANILKILGERYLLPVANT